MAVRRGAVRDFDPHPREGGDLFRSILRAVLFISIHTPARGVTLDALRGLLVRDISIHTPARGVTKGTQAASRPPRFRSTPPRGG